MKHSAKIKYGIKIAILIFSYTLWVSHEINGLAAVLIFITVILDVDISSGSTD